MGFVWLFYHCLRSLLLFLLTPSKLNALIVGLLAHSCRKIDRLSVRPSDLAKSHVELSPCFSGCNGQLRVAAGLHGPIPKAVTSLYYIEGFLELVTTCMLMTIQLSFRIRSIPSFLF